MKKITALVAALALCMGLTVPAFAAERSELPDYISYQFDAVKVDETTGFSYGRYGEPKVAGSFEGSYYYAVTDGTAFTVKNISTAPSSFVYIYCQVYDKIDYFLSQESGNGVEIGSRVEIPGGYFFDIETERYLTAEGEWAFNTFYGYWLLGKIMEDNGAMLKPGESITFTLPDAGKDAAYILYVAYLDPETTNIELDDYTMVQWDYFKYDTAAPAEPEQPTVPVDPVEPVAPAEPEQPAVPAEPVEPAAPAEPEQPAAPATPAEPEQPVAPVTPAVPDAPGSYTVKKGDTWSTICTNFYGTNAQRYALMKANKGVKLTAGAVVTLPETLGKTALIAAPAAGEGETLYTVKLGDTLGTIAKAAYGDSAQYKAIFERNSDRLKDANTIYEGQVIVLPAK